jgi:PilZ domain-containing protein
MEAHGESFVGLQMEEISALGSVPQNFALWYDSACSNLDVLGHTTIITYSIMEKERSKSEGISKRRSTRILLRVPLLVSTPETSPEEDWEPVETVMVSQHGGMIRTRKGFKVGATLEIRMRTKDRIARARVVWKSAEVTPQGIELGFEIMDDPQFWDINFPPDTWSERTRSR